MQPAGMGARAGAVIIAGLTVFVGLGALIAAISGQAHSGDGSVGFNLHGLPAVIWFVLSYGYWIVAERLWGVTIGKLICSIRVQAVDGGRLSWGQSLGRNLLRIVDGFPYILPYLVGFIVAKADGDRRRIGDRAAGTRVTSK